MNRETRCSLTVMLLGRGAGYYIRRLYNELTVDETLLSCACQGCSTVWRVFAVLNEFHMQREMPNAFEHVFIAAFDELMRRDESSVMRPLTVLHVTISCYLSSRCSPASSTLSLSPSLSVCLCMYIGVCVCACVCV